MPSVPAARSLARIVRVTIVRTRTRSGEAIVILPEIAFERLCEFAEDTLDARTIDESQGRLNAGDEGRLDEADLDAVRAAPSPLAFWRARRGMTVAALARDSGVPEVQLTDLETGAGTADPAVYERLARALDIAVEDLVPERVRSTPIPLTSPARRVRPAARRPIE
jgi:hypothetical protein